MFINTQAFQELKIQISYNVHRHHILLIFASWLLTSKILGYNVSPNIYKNYYPALKTYVSDEVGNTFFMH